MIAFNVYLNGNKLCTAGVGDDGVVSTDVSWMRRTGDRRKPNTPEEHLTIDVGGIDGTAGEYVRWQESRILQVGDEIRIKIIDTDTVDRPPIRRPMDEKG
jgi:hypothetical protein